MNTAFDRIIERLSFRHGWGYLVLMGQLVWLGGGTAFSASPPNDDFRNARALSGSILSAPSTLEGATIEPGEPPLQSEFDTGTIWYSWIAPFDGKAFAQAWYGVTPTLHVYTGTALNNLDLVTKNLDRSTQQSFSYGWRASSGTTYYIRASDYFLSNFRLDLRIDPFPSNDDFVDATILTGTNINISGSNYGGTHEPDDPAAGGNSIWYAWTPPLDGIAIVNVGGADIFAKLETFAGTSLNALARVVDANPEFFFDSHQRVWNATNGVSYRIAYSSPDPGDDIQLSLAFYHYPPNDQFDRRILISGTNTTISGSSIGSGREDLEPLGPSSVWYSWTAPWDGNLNLSTESRHTLGVYSGLEVTNLIALPNLNETQGRFACAVQGGKNYSIRLANSWSLFELHLSLTGHPANDDFAYRIPLNGTSVTTTGNNVGASPEPGEPNHADINSNNSIWWTWTASRDGRAIISTEGSTVLTTLAVYVGSSVTALQWLNADVGSGANRRAKLGFDAQAGVTYQIAVSGYNQDDQGAIELHLQLDASEVALPTEPAALPNVKLSKEGLVNAVAVQSDGRIILGGSFSAVSGQERVNLVRLNENSSVDQTWIPRANGPIEHLLINENNLFVAGSFTTINGVLRSGLAKLSLLDGSVDLQWDPKPQGVIGAMAVTGGHLFVGGDFPQIGGISRSNLAKLELTGSGAADAVWNPFPQGTVRAIAAGDDFLIIGGDFYQVGQSFRTTLGKVSTSGRGDVDLGWDPPFDDPFDDKYVLNTTQLLIHQGSVIVGYEYWQGDPLQAIVRIALNTGVLDSSWGGNVGLRASLNSIAVVGESLVVASDPLFENYHLSKHSLTNWDFEGEGWRQPSITSPHYLSDPPGQIAYETVALRALVTKGSQLLIGGEFSSVNGQPALGIALVDGISGTPDGRFRAHVQRPGSVRAFARQPDGKMVIGGEFAFVGEVPRANLARFNQDGTLDSFWSPNPDGAVTALAAGENGLFLGGLFFNVAGVSRTILAKMSYSLGSSPDLTWDAGDIMQVRDSFGDELYPIRDLAVVGNSLMVAGKGTNFDFAVLDANTAQVQHRDGTQVQQIRVQSDQKVVLAGSAGLSRISGVAPFAADPSWNPTPAQGASIVAAAIHSNSVFVAYQGRDLATIYKYDLTTGNSAATWTLPDLAISSQGPGLGPQTLAAVAGDLYVGGLFWPIGYPTAPREGGGKTMLIRLDAATGRVKTSWNTGGQNNDTPVQALFAVDNNLWVGGQFKRFGNESRFGLALLPLPGAPVVGREVDGRITVYRNEADGEEITHFRVINIEGGDLYLNDGRTILQAGDYFDLAQGLAGLRFVSTSGGAGKVTFASAVNATDFGAGTSITTFDLLQMQPPIIRFESQSYSVNEGGDFVDLYVLKIGAGDVTVSYTTTNITALEGLDFFRRASPPLVFSSAVNRLSIRVRVVEDGSTEGDELFGVTFTGATGGAILASPRTAVVTIVDNDIVGSPDSLTAPVAPSPLPLPASGGVLVVTLTPTNGQWRLAGDDVWHQSGESVRGLLDGYYNVEMRPLFGYRRPDDFTAPISSKVTNYADAIYQEDPGTGTEVGNLRVLIKPSLVANNPLGRWRLPGEGEDGWKSGGETISAPVGFQVVEFQNVMNWATPVRREVKVIGDQTNEIEGVYSPLNLSGQAPEMLSLTEAGLTAPYYYNGQIRTRLGFGSGVVVKKRVVLTAAHVLFDDRLLSYASDALWFHRKYKGEYEPEPQVSRGWLKWDGYAAQRQVDGSPGVSSHASQNLDVAAMFFLETAVGLNLPAGGGYGGYLTSDSLQNDWLVSDELKMLVGYPVDETSGVSGGRMYATPPMNLYFTRRDQRVFATSDVRSYPGSSGGPIYVRYPVDGRYYPAAVYLGGSTETLVRAIDTEVVDLINRAEQAGDKSGNHTGGGVARWEAGVTTSPFIPGLFRIEFVPSTIENSAGWRVTGADNPSWISGTNVYYPLTPGPFNIQFKPVPGYITPATRKVEVVIDQTTVVQAAYHPVRLENLRDVGDGRILMTLLGETGRLYTVQWSENLNSWSELITLTNTSGATNLADTPAGFVPHRFYRAIEKAP